MSSALMRAALHAVLTDIRCGTEGGLRYETIQQVVAALAAPVEDKKVSTIDGNIIDLRTPWPFGHPKSQATGWGGNGPGHDGGPGGGRG